MARYDFMCDMAYVPLPLQFGLPLITTSRFGGGSELLRDGDKGNVWHVLEQGMVYADLIASLIDSVSPSS